MPQIRDDIAFVGVFPPRTLAFCRTAVAAVLATLCVAILVLSLAALLALAPIRAALAQTPPGLAAPIAAPRWPSSQ